MIEYSYVNILPQIAQRTQRNAAELYYFAEKDRLVFMWFWGFVVLGFVCDYLRENIHVRVLNFGD